VRISNFVCFPAFVIVFVLATPIASLIYNAPGAGPAVMISAVSIILLGLHQVSTGILQGLGHPTIPMVNMILAAVAKVILNWELTAIPWLGIMGAAWATAADMGVAAIINLIFIYKFIGYRMEIPQLLKTIVASAIMAAAVYFFYDFTMAWWQMGAVSTFGAVFFGCAVYIAVMLVIGGLKEDDLERMPMIGRIGIKFLRKIGVFKAEEKQEA
jgi:stage V sporulation protein B